MTQQCRLASMAAWLSSPGISHHNLLPHIPLIHLSAVNSSPRPEIAPQSPNSSSSPQCLAGDLCPCPGCVWLPQGLSGCRRSAVSLLALDVSSLTQTVVLLWGRDPCFSPPPAEGRSSSTGTPVPPTQSLRPTKFCLALRILFLWTGPPVRSQLVVCVHVCV